MTEEKCYSLEKDGTYCLGFPNRCALTEKEIEEIFSDYGSVISVRTSGDERGFRFVRFKTLEEAESAIEGLKGNKKIRILPKKPRTQNSNEKSSLKENHKNIQQKYFGNKKKSNQNNQDKKKVDEDFNDSFKIDDPLVTESPKHKNFQPYGGTYNSAFRDHSSGSEFQEKVTANGEKENLMKFLRLRSMRGAVANNFSLDSSNFSEENDCKLPENSSQINQNQNKELKDEDNFNNSFRGDETSVSQFPNRKKSQQLSENHKAKIGTSVAEFLEKFTSVEDEKLLKKLKLQAMRLRSNQIDSNSASNFIEEIASNLQEDPVTANLLNDDEPPELISTEEFKQRSIKGSVCGDEAIKIVLAEEVIVANIHEKFSVLYVLYLLENFEPISITEMKTISKNGVRYCSVYFKSQKDAVAVEKQFDNFDLHGNKLIVRTPQLMINEVAAA